MPAWPPCGRYPAGVRARYALLARAGATRGHLRLIGCEPCGDHAWGGYERFYDYGHYAVNIRVPDIRSHWTRIIGAGAKPKSGPTHWVVEAGMEAWDSLSWDPDGTLLDAYTISGRPDVFKDLKGRASEIETVAIHVGDADRAKRFYTALGYSTFFDRRIDDLGAFFHLPDGVVLRDREPLQAGARRASAASRSCNTRACRACRSVRGPVRRSAASLSVSFETDDLEGAAGLVRDHGGTVETAPQRVNLPGVGAADALRASGPDGEGLEFYVPPGRP